MKTEIRVPSKVIAIKGLHENLIEIEFRNLYVDIANALGIAFDNSRMLSKLPISNFNEIVTCVNKIIDIISERYELVYSDTDTIFIRDADIGHFDIENYFLNLGIPFFITNIRKLCVFSKKRIAYSTIGKPNYLHVFGYRTAIRSYKM